MKVKYIVLGSEKKVLEEVVQFCGLERGNAITNFKTNMEKKKKNLTLRSVQQ